MSRKYNWKINGTNYRIVDFNTMRDIRSTKFSAAGQSSIRYNHQEKKVLLISSNLADVTNALERQTWDHDKCPQAIDRGWKAYIFPTVSLMNKHKSIAYGIELDITAPAEKSNSNRIEWQSELS